MILSFRMAFISQFQFENMKNVETTGLGAINEKFSSAAQA